MLAAEEPEALCPREQGSEEALNGAVAGASATPARDAGHGDATSHGQERHGNETQLAQCGCAQTGLEAFEQC